MGTIKTRTNKAGDTSYDAEVRRKGYKPVYETFSRLTDAKKWIQDIESGMRAGRFVSQREATKRTLSEAIDRYIEDELIKKPRSISQQKPQLEWFKRVAGFRVLSDLTAATISDIKRHFLKEEIKPGVTRSGQTWNRYQSILSCVFQMCCGEWQWMEHNPARRIKREKEGQGRVRFLSDDERVKLLDACKVIDPGQLYTAVVLTLSTGMRKSEVLGLKWEDVDVKKGVILLQDTKNGERRRLPVRGMALTLLTEHARVRRIDSQLVFPGVGKGKKYNLRHGWDLSLDKAKIEDFHFHDLRHSCASYLAMNGASLLEIAEVLGHKTLQMVKRYSHFAESHTAGVLERMSKKIFEAGN